MRSLVFMFLLILAAFSTYGQDNTLLVPLSEPGNKGTLSVDLNRGKITIIGTNRKDIKITYLTGKTNQPTLVEGKNGLKKISGGSPGFEISESDNKVDIETYHSNKPISFNIEVPHNFNLKLDCMNGGEMIVKNVSGDLDLENYNGDIIAEKVTGSMTANSYNGKIKVSFESIDKDKPLAFSTFNQDIDITLPANVQLSPRIKSERGEILTGFDMELAPMKAKQEKDEEGTKIYVGSWISGKINGGGPELRIETYNGNVYIRKRD